MGIWNNGWNGTDLMDYHIFLLLNSFFSSLHHGLCWANSLLHTLPFSDFSLVLLLRFLASVILLLCFRTGLGGLARKRHFLVVETSHRIRAVACLIRNSRWRWRWMGKRLGSPTFIIFGSNEGVCVDRDKQTNNVEVLDEPYLLYL
jgi:hypothetical protein